MNTTVDVDETLFVQTTIAIQRNSLVAEPAKMNKQNTQNPPKVDT